ncbi:unnamed protein product [[Actinomadura] parvosata subsp. kistnae]|nr:hypothetical protein [Nonomuraea sp. ATCC 55076]SPL96862.1 unnamed protein product [Actinomadura parvosata subsp. kistnae]
MEIWDVLRSPADQAVTLIHRASGLRTRLDLAAGLPHLVEIR